MTNTTQAFKVIPMSEACLHPQLYALTKTIQNYPTEDFKDLHTVEVDAEGGCNEHLNITRNDASNYKQVWMACWSDVSLHCDQLVDVYQIGESWYVFVEDDQFPDWL